MKKFSIFICLFFSFISSGQAQTRQERLDDLYFSESQDPPLTTQQQKSLFVSKKYSADDSFIQPVNGADGSVIFHYGAHQYTIVCAVLQLCDLQLQPGEQVNSIHMGDTARWIIEPGVTGSGENEIQHLIIKPMDIGLDTSLVVTTDRRSYHLRLRSHRSEFMPKIAFSYPEEPQIKWESLKLKREKERKNMTVSQSQPGDVIGSLDFNYSVDGSAQWKPLRVYNNGLKTIIEMPETMDQKEAPILLLVRKEGGIFSDEELEHINHRIHDNRYIVDFIFDQAILVSGVGRNQDRVTIRRKK